MRRLIVSLGVCVFAAAVLGAAAGARVASKTATFHLIEKSVAFNFIDNPPRQGPHAAPLAGDQLTIASEMQSKAGAHAGWPEATCTVARGGNRSEGPCYGVYRFKGGQLFAMAALNFYGNAPTQIAIVGRTGVYKGVTGNLRSVSRGENSPYTDDTFNLVWP